MGFEQSPFKKPDDKSAPRPETPPDPAKVVRDLFAKERFGTTDPKQFSEWEEYLLRTGNPILNLDQKRAGLELERLKAEDRGDTEAVKKLQEQINRLQEEQMLMVFDGIRDTAFSFDVAQRIRPQTGDIKKDAENLFQGLGATGGLELIAKGADPASLLKRYAEILDAMVEKSKGDESLRRMAFAAISIRRIIEKILDQASN